MAPHTVWEPGEHKVQAAAVPCSAAAWRAQGARGRQRARPHPHTTAPGARPCPARRSLPQCACAPPPPWPPRLALPSRLAPARPPVDNALPPVLSTPQTEALEPAEELCCNKRTRRASIGTPQQTGQAELSDARTGVLAPVVRDRDEAAVQAALSTVALVCDGRLLCV